MDTHGKTNMEFNNEVNKILAQHKSSFDKVNVALQAVLTELQALRTTHNPNASPSKINLFAHEESLPQNATQLNPVNNHSHQHLKLSFLKFNGDDLTG